MDRCIISLSIISRHRSIAHTVSTRASVIAVLAAMQSLNIRQVLTERKGNLKKRKTPLHAAVDLFWEG